MINYIKGDIFDLAPEGAHIAHSCNAQGVWGSGFAKECKFKYPLSFRDYNEFCLDMNNLFPSLKLGSIKRCSIENDRYIICLITSNNYGSKKDSIEQILQSTEKAIVNCLISGYNELHMPKINSGFFGVPWQETEKILKKYEDQMIFNIYSL